MTAPLSTDEATALLTSILMDPQWSVDSIADLPKDDPFGKLCYDLAEIRAHVQALSKGDLSRGSKARGFVAGSLKATEANLRHLTWQMERVAQGDYSQSVSFMGDFSKAFNKMSREMHSKAEELSRLLGRMSDLRGSEVVIPNGGTGYRFNTDGNQVSYRCDVKKVTTINYDRNKVRNHLAALN